MSSWDWTQWVIAVTMFVGISSVIITLCSDGCNAGDPCPDHLSPMERELAEARHAAVTAIQAQYPGARGIIFVGQTLTIAGVYKKRRWWQWLGYKRELAHFEVTRVWP